MSDHTSIQAQEQVRLSLSITSGLLQSKSSDYRKKRQLLQRRAVRQTGAQTVPPIVQEVLRSPRASLDAATRAFFEPRFGAGRLSRSGR